MTRPQEMRRAAIADLGVVCWTARPGHADWRVTTIGRGIERMLGFQKDEWRAEGFWIAKTLEGDRDAVVSHLEQAWRARGRHAEVWEYRMLDALGNVRWLRTSARRSSPRSRALVGAHLDVTDEFQTLEASRLSTERLRFVAAAGNLHWWDEPIDTHDRVTNAALASLAGIDPKRRTTPAEWLTRVHPRDRDRYVRSVTQWTDDAHAAPEHTEPPEAVSYRVRHVDGSIRWITTTMARAQAGSGLGPHVLGAAADITASVNAAKLDRDDLAHMQRLATLGELATSIAHELNQPLTTIMAAASTARRMLRDAPDDDVLNGIIADILEAVVRAADVVRRARAMVRRDNPVVELLAINDLVSDVARLVGSDLVIRQVELTLDLDRSVAAVRGDRVQLQQVVLNLLLNAVDAVSDSPPAARKIVLSTRAHDAGGIAMTVRDTGPGIPPALGDRVFEPFVTTKRQGTGLGLAIVRAIVEAHAGQIGVETPEEGGAAFRVVLPAC